MQTTPWRIVLEQAFAAQTDSDARLMQLATVDAGGAPDVRTVVFRGWAEAGDGLLFTADARSAKIEQTRRQAQVALCWYLRDTREQFRLAGRVKWVDEKESDAAWKDLRQRAWAALPDATRQTFNWPDPGAPRAEGLQAMKFGAPPPDPQAPLATFVLGCVEPYRVDHLMVQEAPHQRTRYQRDQKGAWSIQNLNP